MNAFSTTTRDLAAALLGKPRIAQSVHTVTSTYGGGLGARHVVLIVKDGEEAGTYFECGDRIRDLLIAGTSAEELELEPYEPEEAA